MLSREELLMKADALNRQPEAIEAFWDGDTHGWFVVLTAVFHEAQRLEFRYKEEDIIGVLQGEGGDFRAFTGQVPPWPEAQLAQEVGQEIAAKLGVPFYFASPNYPELDCPRWWQREQAYPCRRCGIPLLQSENIPWYGLCSHCHWEEGRGAKS